MSDRWWRFFTGASPSISKFSCDGNGLCSWLNPGTPTAPLRVLNTVRDFTSPDLSPTATSYQIPAANFTAGDKVELQRFKQMITVENTFTTTVPNPPPPPPTAPTVTNAKTVVSGTTVIVTAGCSSDVTAATLQDGSSSPISATPSNGVLSWTLVNESVGTHTYMLAVANAAGLTATATASAVVSSPPPPPPTGSRVFFGDAGNPFIRPVAASPTLDPNSAAWCSATFTSNAIAGANVAVKSTDGWPVNYAKSTDPVVTVSAPGGTYSFHLPQGARISNESDGHCLIIGPDGKQETEMWQTKITGTWPNQTVTCNHIGQFADVSTDSSSSIYAANGQSARGDWTCCLVGLVMESEYLYALQNGTPIPHALAASMPHNSSQIRSPALRSDGGYSNGPPMGAHWWLPRSVNISGLPAALIPIALTLQEYGWFSTDSGSFIGFQGEMTTDNNASYVSLDQNSLLEALPWSKMVCLAAGQ